MKDHVGWIVAFIVTPLAVMAMLAMLAAEAMRPVDPQPSPEWINVPVQVIR